MAEQISIRTFPTRPEAEAAQGLLASAGIASWVEADDAGGAFPFALADGAKLMIDESDRDQAAQLLTDTEG